MSDSSFRCDNTPSPQNLINQGNKLYYENKLDEALEYYTKASELEDDNQLIWYNRGMLRYWLGQYQLAQEDFERYLILKPDMHIALNNWEAIEKLRRYGMILMYGLSCQVLGSNLLPETFLYSFIILLCSSTNNLFSSGTFPSIEGLVNNSLILIHRRIKSCLNKW